MGIYIVDFDSVVYDATAPRHRAPRILAFARALIQPVKTLFATFLGFRAQIILRLSYNYQTIVLERALNHTFYSTYDPYNPPPIWIENTPNQTPQPYLFTLPEQLPLTLYTRSETKPQGARDNLHLYLLQAYQSNYDFIVHAPQSLSGELKRIRGVVDRYRQVGMRYKVDFY
jgi:hypothetical protein